MIQRLAAFMNGGAVKRFHTVDTLRVQTVAAHTHGVLLIILEIHPHASLNLLKAAIYHDLAEGETGDIPANAKWGSEALTRALRLLEEEFDEKYNLYFPLDAFESAILKWADMADLVMFCLNEYDMGNRSIRPVLERGLEYLGNIQGSVSGVGEPLRQQMENYYRSIK